MLIVGVGIWFIIRSAEPSYEGRSLSSWLNTERAGRLSLEAQIAIRHIGSNAVPFLMKKLRSENPEWKRSAVAYFERHQMDRPAFRFAYRDWSVAVAGFRAIGSAGSGAIPGLTTMLVDTNKTYEAALCLAGIGSAAVPALTNALRSSAANVRLGIVAALGCLETNGTPAVPALLARLQDKHSRVRRSAAASLGRIKQEPGVVVPALADLLGDTDPAVRQAAVTSIGNFGSTARLALCAVLSTVEDANVSVRHSAASAVLSITDYDPNPVFLKRLTNSSSATRLAAVYGLLVVGRRDSNVVAALRICVHDSDQRVRKEAASLLMSIDRKGARRPGTWSAGESWTNAQRACPVSGDQK